MARTRRRVLRRVTCGALVASALALSCSRPAELRYEAELDQAPAAAAHAVHEVRLAELMRGLEALRRDRLPKAIDPAEAEARQAREVARVARAMAESARRIPLAAPDDLDPARRSELESLAARLASLCDTLAEDVGSLDDEARGARLAEIDATCTGCHDRYRIPGPR